MVPVPVSIVRCADYSDVPAAVERALALLGGIHRFVRPGQRVLVKPNLLSDRAPELACTTHPEVARAVVRLVRAAGAIPVVGDSPSNVTKVERVWEKTGFRAMCDEERVPLLSLEKAGSESFSVDGIRFHVAKPVLDADVIISVPKVKTHVLTVLTAAVKNMYGIVPGFQKTTFHKLYPRPAQFGRALAAIYSRVAPALAVADAVVGMDGDGPSGGAPTALGFVAASGDGVALDLALCQLLGIDPRVVPYFAPLRALGVGVPDTGDVELVGDPVSALALPAFRTPSTLKFRLLPSALVRLVQPLFWIRPRMTDACIRCGQCVKACPADALRLPPESKPVLSPRKCVECCCCHEVCPVKAVRMTPSPIARLVYGRSVSG